MRKWTESRELLVPFTRWVYWLIAVTAYWFCARWLLYRVFRIFIDGGGAMATFYWGDHDLGANLADYIQNRGTRLRFLYPYWIAASVITFVGCGLTTWLICLFKPRR